MTLPTRNLFIRCCYGLAMLGMFAFLAWQSWLPLSWEAQAATVSPKPAATAAAESATASIKSSAPIELSKTTNAEQPAPKAPSSSWQPVDSMELTGLTKLIDLNVNIEKQINQHWDDFGKSALADHIRPDKPIYAVYRNYDTKKKTVLLTLGLRKPVKGFDQITVPAGRYEAYPEQTVLNVWRKTTKRYSRYHYRNDFERWLLDDDYKPSSVTAYLSIK